MKTYKWALNLVLLGSLGLGYGLVTAVISHAQQDMSRLVGLHMQAPHPYAGRSALGFWVPNDGFYIAYPVSGQSARRGVDVAPLSNPYSGDVGAAKLKKGRQHFNYAMPK